MEKDIIVSVICNAFNHGKYIRDALEGFVNQKTNFKFEVLIHDDASTDDTADIIREYEEKYPNIIKPIYQTENQYTRGGRITIRFQVPRIKGKYVAFCEGDDYWTDPLKLQKQYDFLENNPDYSMCVCSCIWLDMRNGKQSTRCQTTVDSDISLEEIVLERKGRPFQTATFFLRSDLYKKRPEWTMKFGVGDTPLAMYLALCGKIRILADVMAVYRNHANGSWTSRIDEDAQYKIKVFSKMIEGMNAFNEATNYKYQTIASKRIHTLQYNIARLNRDLKVMRSGELREIYKSRRFLARISDILACKLPCLYTLMHKILRNL